ncbi:uncharacterized protein F5147DRAFT_659265 [Suillus discolor]|uniref:Uncharacterized protein n=1 Tax=Suillus discolor TaxID=1912936 RepID=A0A9P7JLF3_9AGAM|nr:uncharacterized protein F5147DRAFT_659265 [Suillus discolor]KAG2086237.1 hypothetical protein F5147DRAFT_659265 [Suillus discolor]
MHTREEFDILVETAQNLEASFACTPPLSTKIRDVNDLLLVQRVSLADDVAAEFVALEEMKTQEHKRLTHVAIANLVTKHLIGQGVKSQAFTAVICVRQSSFLKWGGRQEDDLLLCCREIDPSCCASKTGLHCVRFWATGHSHSVISRSLLTHFEQRILMRQSPVYDRSRCTSVEANLTSDPDNRLKEESIYESSAVGITNVQANIRKTAMIQTWSKTTLKQKAEFAFHSAGTRSAGSISGHYPTLRSINNITGAKAEPWLTNAKVDT